MMLITCQNYIFFIKNLDNAEFFSTFAYNNRHKHPGLFGFDSERCGM